MKKYIIAAILLIPIAAFGWGIGILQGGGGSGGSPTSCIDDLDGGSGVLDDWVENCGVWGVNRQSDGTAKTGYLDLANNRLERTEGTGVTTYILNTGFTPTDADYSANLDTWVSDEANLIIRGPIVRGVPGVSDVLNGYGVYIRVNLDKCRIVRYVDGSSTELTDTTIDNLDWTSSHNIKLEVVGSGVNTVISAYIDGSVTPDCTYDDDGGSALDAKGNAGFQTWQSTGYTVYVDNIEVEDD